MPEISALINQMLSLLIIAAAGYILGKAKKMDSRFCGDMSWIVINIASFPMIVGSALKTGGTIALTLMLTLLGVTFLVHGITYIISVAVSRTLRINTPDRGTAEYMLTFGNLIFIGYPILRVLYGDMAIIYATIFAMPLNSLGYSVGAAIVGRGRSKIKITPLMLLNPPFIASLLAILIVTLRPPCPALVTDTLNMVGSISIPCGMLVVGASLSASPLKKILIQWKVIILSLSKLIIAPAAVFFLLRLFIRDPLILGVSTIMAATPIAVNSTMICIQYKGNPDLASSGVFISTLLSIITIPVIRAILS